MLLLAAAAWGSLTAFTPILAHICSQPIFSMTLSRFLMGLLQGETSGVTLLRRGRRDLRRRRPDTVAQAVKVKPLEEKRALRRNAVSGRGCRFRLSVPVALKASQRSSGEGSVIGDKAQPEM